MGDSTTFSARCSPEQKEAYQALATRLGYTRSSGEANLSAMITGILDLLSGQVPPEEHWECRTVHVEDGRVVGVGPELQGGARAFRIAAPEAFWESLSLPG